MLPASISHIQTNLLPANSTTLTKKMYHPHQQFHVLVPPFKHHHHSAGPGTPSRSPMMSLPIKPSLPPSLECITTSTIATRTSNKSKRLFKSVAPSDTKGHPVKTMKLQRLSRDSTKSNDWNLDLSHLHLRHQHLLTSPFQHHLYQATHKLQPIPRTPVPESAQWPIDRLHPSNTLPKDNRVQGLKLAAWEHEYWLF